MEKKILRLQEAFAEVAAWVDHQDACVLYQGDYLSLEQFLEPERFNDIPDTWEIRIVEHIILIYYEIHLGGEAIYTVIDNYQQYCDYHDMIFLLWQNQNGECLISHLPEGGQFYALGASMQDDAISILMGQMEYKIISYEEDVEAKLIAVWCRGIVYIQHYYLCTGALHAYLFSTYPCKHGVEYARELYEKALEHFNIFAHNAKTAATQICQVAEKAGLLDKKLDYDASTWFRLRRLSSSESTKYKLESGQPWNEMTLPNDATTIIGMLALGKWLTLMQCLLTESDLGDNSDIQ